jgi:hypothetical protein
VQGSYRLAIDDFTKFFRDLQLWRTCNRHLGESDALRARNAFISDGVTAWLDDHAEDPGKNPTKCRRTTMEDTKLQQLMLAWMSCAGLQTTADKCIRLHNLFRDPSWSGTAVLPTKYAPSCSVAIDEDGELVDPIGAAPLTSLPKVDVGVNGKGTLGSSLRNRIRDGIQRRKLDTIIRH